MSTALSHLGLVSISLMYGDEGPSYSYAELLEEVFGPAKAEVRYCPRCKQELKKVGNRWMHQKRCLT
jgi:hypothetical protein